MGLTGDAWVQIRVSAPTPLMIAQTLAGWGDLVEVVEPPSLRAELAQLGSELVAPVGERRRPTAGERPRPTARIRPATRRAVVA